MYILQRLTVRETTGPRKTGSARQRMLLIKNLPPDLNKPIKLAHFDISFVGVIPLTVVVTPLIKFLAETRQVYFHLFPLLIHVYNLYFIQIFVDLWSFFHSTNIRKADLTEIVTKRFGARDIRFGRSAMLKQAASAVTVNLM